MAGVLKDHIYKYITVAIAMVWTVNGLICKVLGYVPRHRMIVAGILGEEYAGLITKIIGLLELIMVVWILTGIKSRWCTYTQIAVVAAMNVMECIVVPELLLFGRMNALFAFVFIMIVYVNEFYHRPKPVNLFPR